MMSYLPSTITDGHRFFKGKDNKPGFWKRLKAWCDENLEHLDPMPWHQALLLGLALAVLLLLASIPGA